MIKRSPILLSLMTRLGELDFEECWLPSEQHRYILGYWHPEGRIQVNPMPHVVETIIHELCHETYPTYSERAIASLTGKLFKQLTDAEVQAIYAAYRRNVDGA